jgi:hypothetical protein
MSVSSDDAEVVTVDEKNTIAILKASEETVIENDAHTRVAVQSEIFKRNDLVRIDDDAIETENNVTSDVATEAENNVISDVDVEAEGNVIPDVAVEAEDNVTSDIATEAEEFNENTTEDISENIWLATVEDESADELIPTTTTTSTTMSTTTTTSNRTTTTASTTLMSTTTTMTENIIRETHIELQGLEKLTIIFED